jgi:hypothetical protein
MALAGRIIIVVFARGGARKAVIAKFGQGLVDEIAEHDLRFRRRSVGHERSRTGRELQ